MWGNGTILLLAGSFEVFIKNLLVIIAVIMTAVVSLLVVYFIYIFFLMATASDENKRRSAKSRLLKTLSSIAIIIVLIYILRSLSFSIDTPTGQDSSGPDGFSGILEGEMLKGATLNDTSMLISNRKVSNPGGVEANAEGYPSNALSGTMVNFYYYGTANYKPSSITLPSNSDVKVVNISNVTINANGFFEKKYWVISEDGSGGYSVRYNIYHDGGKPLLAPKKDGDTFYLDVMVEFTVRANSDKTKIAKGMLGGRLILLFQDNNVRHTK